MMDIFDITNFEHVYYVSIDPITNFAFIEGIPFI